MATVLAARDVAITAYNTDPATAGTAATFADTLTFLVTRAVEAGTVISFTNRNWNGTAFAAAGAGEGILTYTVPAGGLAAGAQVTLTAAQLQSAGINLADTGDTVYVFQGAAATPTFLYAANIADGNTTFDANQGVLTGTGLTAGITAIAIAGDNAAFGGRSWNLQLDDVLTSIGTNGQWAQSDVRLQDAPTGNAFNAPDRVAFTAVATINNSNQSSIAVAYGDANGTQVRVTQALQNLAGENYQDIVVDPARGVFYVIERDLQDNSTNRIQRGSLASLLDTPGTPPTLTTVYAGSADNNLATRLIISSPTFDRANNILYFAEGDLVRKIDLNAGNPTPVTLADLSPDPAVTGQARNLVLDLSVNFATGQVYAMSTRVIIATDGTSTVNRNAIFTASGLTTASGANSLTFTQVNYDATGIGILRGIDVDPATGDFLIATGTYTRPGGGGTVYGGVYRSGSVANGSVTTLFRQDASDGTERIDAIEADGAGRYFITVNPQNSADNAPAGGVEGRILVGATGGAGRPVEFGQITYRDSAGVVNTVGDPVADNQAQTDSIEINTAPTLSGSTPGVTFRTSDGTAVAPASGFQTADVDAVNAQLRGAQVRISAGQVAGDQLLFTSQNGITGSYNAARGVLTLTGAASFDTYEAVLNSVRFSTTAQNPGTARTISYSTFDGVLYSDEVNAPVTIFANVAPTATIAIDDAALNIGDDALVTITFSEAVTGFTNADLTVENGTLSAVTTANGGVTWTATLTPNGGITDPTNVITLNNAGVVDSDNLAGSGTTTSPNYAIDTVRPGVTLTSVDGPSGSGVGAGPITLTATFSETVSGFTSADVAVTNGTVSSVSGSGSTYTLTVRPTASGQVTVQVVAEGVQDAAGNGNVASAPYTFVADATPPTATIAVADTNLTAGETTPVTITFSEPVTGFTNADLTVENGTLSTVSSSDGGRTWTATLTPAANVADASNVITLNNAGVADRFGNSGTGTTASNNYAVATANTGPVNTVPATFSVQEDASTAVAVTGLSVSDADANDTITVALSVTAAAGTLSVGTTTGLTFTAGDGTADQSMTFSGSQSAVNAALASVTFTQVPDFNGTATVTLASRDQAGVADTDTVAITIAPVADTAATSITVDEDAAATPVAIDLSGFEDAGRFISAVGTSTLGTVTIDTKGTADRTDDSVVFTPFADANGTGSFTYTVTAGGVTEQGTVAVTVNAVDDAPVAVADAPRAAENVVTTFDLAANDTDVDGGSRAIVTIEGQAATVGRAIVLASGARVTLRADGRVDYDPSGRFNYLVAEGGASSGAQVTAADGFRYALNGGSEARVSVTVTGVDGPGDQLRGTAGNDRIGGTAGPDLFRLEAGGDDVADGGTGNDSFLFGAALSAADRVTGGAGEDIVAIQGDYADLVLGAETLVGTESFNFLAGSDTRFGDPGTNRYSYKVTTSDATVAAGLQYKVNASSLLAGERVEFDGSAETDGSFLMYGGQGTDVFTGGRGNDLFFFSDGRFNAGDRVTGGAGTDTLVLRGDYAGAKRVVFAADALSGIESVALLGAADTRYVASGGQFGYDITLDDAGAAAGTTFTVNGAQLSAAERVVVNGAAEQSANLRLFSGAGDDRLTGGGGNDLLYGGQGFDTLAGGAGNDTFRFDTVADSRVDNPDLVTDFARGDLIDLSRIDAVAGTPANEAFTFVEGAFTRVAGQARASFLGNFDTGALWQVQVDVDGDGVADMSVNLIVTDRHAITASDFLL